MRTLLLVILSLSILNCSNKEQQNISCENLIKIDSLSFCKNKHSFVWFKTEKENITVLNEQK